MHVLGLTSDQRRFIAKVLNNEEGRRSRADAQEFIAKFIQTSPEKRVDVFIQYHEGIRSHIRARELVARLKSTPVEERVVVGNGLKIGMLAAANRQRTRELIRSFMSSPHDERGDCIGEMVFSKRSMITAAAAIGSFALLPSVAQAFNNGTSGAVVRALLNSTVNVKDPTYGAVGNGSTDDLIPLTNALAVAFGSIASPHGQANRALNKPIFFPGGNYRITDALYLLGVQGGLVFGNGAESTTISYQWTGTGNVIATSTSNANKICPCFMFPGTSYTTFDGFTLGCTDPGTSTFPAVGIFLYQDATTGQCSANLFSNGVVAGFTTGCLGGLGGNGGNCDNMTFRNINWGTCDLAGLRPGHQNALNYSTLGGGATNCGAGSTGVFGNNGAGYSMPVLPMAIVSPSMSGNPVAFSSGAGQSFSLIGGSSEEPVCIRLGGTGVFLSGFAHRNTTSGDSIFLDCTGGGFFQASNCSYGPSNDTGPGVIALLDNTGYAIFDALSIASAGGTSKITGVTGSTVAARGTTPPSLRSTILSAFTGTIAQNI